ncbi:ribosomal L1 domain-containing protein 1-like [Oncorhynchus nerka]|uniref:ribosomal L1 domain-containing protein 1-like n=1 Tax=Oncorhynchus nerka TaxID=8023 RepID=UPI0031B87C1B
MADKQEDLPLDRVQKAVQSTAGFPEDQIHPRLCSWTRVNTSPSSHYGRSSSRPRTSPCDPLQDTEDKPFEAKRRLLGNFDMFLSDDRIRRLLSSHIGKHFYERKKEPLSLNLQSKKLALDIQRTIQGTTTSISKKGCYW